MTGNFVAGNAVAGNVVAGNISATTLAGNGATLTALNASNITSGKLPSSALPTNLAITDAVVVNSLVGDGSLLTFSSLGVGTLAPTQALHVVGNAIVTGNAVAARLGAGTQAPAEALHVVGNIIATGSVTAFASDQRLKANVSRIDSPLLRLSKLKGVFYDFNELAGQYGLAGHHVGVIAQDVEAALPEAVRPAPFDVDHAGGSKTGMAYKTVQYDKLVPLLVEAVLELQSRLETRA